MNSKRSQYGVGPSLAQSDLYLNSLSLLVLSIPHSPHHHEHPAH